MRREIAAQDLSFVTIALVAALTAIVAMRFCVDPFIEWTDNVESVP